MTLTSQGKGYLHFMRSVLLALVLVACATDPLHIRDPGGDNGTDDGPVVDTDTDLDTDVADSDDPGGTPVTGPQRYPFGTVHSPVTPWIADHWRGIAASAPAMQSDVFMKVGASSLDSTNSLNCFAGSSVDLGEHADLADIVAYFNGGDAAGSTPWDRESVAAVSGRTAAWAIEGNPSPVDSEIAAISPRYALVHHGTNDMGMGSTYESAMPGFYEAYSGLVSELSNRGIVPVLATISHRGDRESADRWVSTYNAVIHGIAQREQVPLVDWWWALDALPHKGLSSDGIHVERHPSGACIFTDEGLEHGYNVRNLLSAEVFDRAKRVVVDGVSELDPEAPGLAGNGGPNNPFVVDSLPFVHDADTSTSPFSAVDEYSCDDANESGPELTYAFTVNKETAVRIFVNARGTVDPDIHLLSQPGNGNSCVARGHRAIETTISAGTWYVAVDSWTDSAGIQRSGDYLLTIVECDADDTDCR